MRFKKFIKERLSNQSYVVVYSGRFQPATVNHYLTYEYLVNRFGKNNVYIGTSNKIDPPKSPFSFNEKKEIMTTMFGIPSNKIVQLKNPYAPEELLKHFPKETALISVIGEKDVDRIKQGKYFKPYKDNIDMKSYEKEGYYIIAPLQTKKFKGKLISGTLVRDIFNKKDDKEKKELFGVLYPKFNSEIYNLLIKKLK